MKGGFVTVVFEGLNVQSSLSQLSQRGICLFKVQKVGKTCRITVKNSDRRNVVDFLTNKCYNIVSVNEHGLTGAICYVKKHALLLCAVIVCIACALALKNVCFGIEIDGNVQEKVVLDALAESGICVGAKLPENCNKLASLLVSKIGASYVSVQKNGNKLYVSAEKSQLTQKVDLTAVRNIVATCDGIVTAILTEQGTPNVQKGDYVKKGDVLIYGKRTFSDGTFVGVMAVGKVVVQAESRASVVFDGTTEVTQDTGKTAKVTCIKLAKAQSTYTVPFKQFRTEEKVITLYPLGVQVVTKVFFQTATVTQQTTFSAEENNLKARALQQAMQNAHFTVNSVAYFISGNSVTAVVSGNVVITN